MLLVVQNNDYNYFSAFYANTFKTASERNNFCYSLSIFKFYHLDGQHYILY